MPKLAWLLVALFPLSEVGLAVFKRSRSNMAAEDRGTMRLLWVVTIGSVAAAILLQGVSATRLSTPANAHAWAGLGLLVAGLAVRWAAILALGRLFTVDVAIRSGHSLVDSGLYRFVRHPSYTGLLLAFSGLGLLLENWLSLAALVVPIALVLVHRIEVEESALRERFGSAYTAYCARTKRLVPGLY